VLEAFTTHPRVTEVLGRGEKQSSVRFGHEGIQVDLRALPEASFGAALQYFTGSKEHNVALRQRALKMGFTLSEYALAKGRTRMSASPARARKRFTRRSASPWDFRRNCARTGARSKPRRRAAAKTGGTSAIFAATCTLHTTETDGRATLQEMAEAARAQGYEYIAITDHSKGAGDGDGLDENERCGSPIRFVRWINREWDCACSAALECDIKRDGGDGSGKTTRWRSSIL